MATVRNCGILIAMTMSIALLSGCASLTSGQRSSQFGVQMLAFENAMRWGKFQSADTFRKRPPGAMPSNYPQYEGVKITAYEVLSQQPGEDANHVTREVKIDYYWDSSPSVRTLTQIQHWVYEPDEKLWYLEDELPEFK